MQKFSLCYCSSFDSAGTEAPILWLRPSLHISFISAASPFKVVFLYLLVSRSQQSKILHILVVSLHLASIQKNLTISLFSVSNRKCSVLLEQYTVVFHSCLMEFLFCKFKALFEWMLLNKNHHVIGP